MTAKEKKAAGTVWQRIHKTMSAMAAASTGGVEPDEAGLRELWKRRAVELAKPAETADDNLHWEKVIILKVSKERYAFRVKDVEEIMRLSSITPVPCVPGYFRGVINRRGTILPLVDLKIFFGGEKSSDNKDSRVVVLSGHRMNLGLLVEAADKIVGIAEENIKPPLRRGDAIHEEFSDGVIALDKKVVVLINSRKLLQDPRLKVDKAV